MNTLDTVELHRLDRVQVRIVVDPEPYDPRTDRDNFGAMVCWHKRYELGDKHSFADREDFITDIIGEQVNDRIEKWWDRQYNLIPGRMGSDIHKDALEALNRKYHARRWAEVEKRVLILPLHLYDHSGITINTTGFSCPWDSGQVGYIYVTKADARKEFGKRLTTVAIEKAMNLMRAEVETYDDYLRGNVYGYVVSTLPDEDEIEDDGDEAEGEQLDSLWGIWGLDYARQEAMEAARSENEKLHRALVE